MIKATIPMETWFSKKLGDGTMAYEPSDRIEKAFLTLFATAGKPVDMAVFTRHELTAHLHCEVIAYFSPAAAEIARLFSAEPCGRPSPKGMDLLAGDRCCWRALFPEGED